MECTTTVPTGSVVVLCLILRERERGGYRHDTRNRSLIILSDDDAHDDGSGGRGALTGNRLAYYHCDSHK